MASNPDGVGRLTDGEWDDAYIRLRSRDITSLTPDELEVLAQSAFWAGHPRDAIGARQRAYRHHRDGGRHEQAARAGWLLFHSHFELDEVAAASGWLTRARRHATEVPDSPERGYVAIAASLWAAYSGELDGAVQEATFAREVGEAASDRDLAAWGSAVLGGMLTARGDIAAGLAHLDDAMLEVTGGELSRFVTGWIYCYLLRTCHALGDVARAVEWTDSAVRWCATSGESSWYPGVCRLHQCEVATLRGEWETAEQEALRAAEELRPFGDYLVAHGQYIAGEIRLYTGRFSGAEDAFRRSHELGGDPQPGLGLLRLAQGDVGGAVSQLRRAVTDGWQPPLPRARVLSAHVKAELAAGDVTAAERSLGELRSLSQECESDLLRALVLLSEAAVAVAHDDLDAAQPALRRAVAICRQLECPYELAHAQLAMGEVARRMGDEETARLEFEAARAGFEDLGARPDEQRAATLSDPRPAAAPAGLTERELEVLRLLAGGSSNRDIAEALTISEHTVRRHLSNSYRKMGVTSRSAATAFMFEHGLG